ncbi:MAG: hypothetical protein E5X49_27755 [Mesorhizobium sp.]|nr:MAG: hypothetical protein EOQ28_29225 [Mesorhizobium sp.]RWB95782.1 MAG: hypothetical protein EOQ57_28665 [Mesorhizobium sp.]RWG78089.1 MAG: hypothetical protein EOQ69_27415 [Mesorhizobium sp.]RWG90567.1 MAG: hypothetical protein EOQ70_04045 [Mesorhizobium sp.]RWJ98914.1 MAG: hypothetical protein EOR42_26320 [Mesorhizobium sp.]
MDEGGPRPFGDAGGTARPSVLPDISPTRGEIRRHAGVSPISQRCRNAPAQKLPISPLVGEMPGRAEGGAKE